MEFIIKNNKHLLKNGRNVIGYVSPDQDGYSYYIGKPSDRTVAKFTSRGYPFDLETAKQRLIESFTVKI
jgi:hypothetical protein